MRAVVTRAVGMKQGRVEAGRRSPPERQRAGAGAAKGRGLPPCGGSPRGPGQAEEQSLLVHLWAAQALEGVRGGTPCGDGEGEALGLLRGEVIRGVGVE